MISANMAKKEAPAAITGGAGFLYEDNIAARFLLDLLSGKNSLGEEFGRVMRVDWQVRDDGWLIDDLVVSSNASGSERAAALSIKSNRQVVASGFPKHFVESAWEQWLGHNTERKFNEDRDALVIATGQLANNVGQAWAKLLMEALQTTSERLLARLSTAKKSKSPQSSKTQRSLFTSLHCPKNLSQLGKSDDLATARLLRHIRVLHFDFEKPGSQDLGRALLDCQSVLETGTAAKAKSLWRHLTAFASEKRSTGGSVDIGGLLAALNGHFDLSPHPDFRSDWEAINRHTKETMENVRTEIVGLSPLSRKKELQKIEKNLKTHGICLITGESGSGKSALMKVEALRNYKNIFWPSAELLDSDNSQDLEKRLGLLHSLIDVLGTAVGPSLIVIDAIEACSERGLRLLSHLLRVRSEKGADSRVHVLLAFQIESSQRILTRLAEDRLAIVFPELLAIERPAEEEITKMVKGVPGLRWSTLRVEMRSILTNLKILDWVIQATKGGFAIDGQSFMGLTQLIEKLWTRWVEGTGDGRHARAGLLMQIASIEADTLSAGVPLSRLEHAQQQALPGLESDDLLHVRSARIFLSHDLLGDWARMMFLVSENPSNPLADPQRITSPRWHRAIRLFGQKLLEESTVSRVEWQRTVAKYSNGTDGEKIVCDLLLESVFLATNARTLLEIVWPVLIADGGSLLHRMIDRFLFVATLPDPRLQQIADTSEQATQLEHLFRIPYWPYWLPFLATLHAHRTEIIPLMPLNVARVCNLWLRTMPKEFEPGHPLSWRNQAAELAIDVTREIQKRKADGQYFTNKADQVVYEALLYAAMDFPDLVSELLLELAGRRELPVKKKVTVKKEQKVKIRYPILLPRGDLHEPWPDGPRFRVSEAFQNACLSSGAFVSLAQAKPEVALEVLLAVCIEEPKYDNYHSYSLMMDCGVEHWMGGHPPLYFRGPFLQFLKAAPEQGLSFILRLINFATRRCTETEPERLRSFRIEQIEQVEVPSGITLTINRKKRHWLGDSRTFRWHNDFPPETTIIPSALMALEKWLYEQIDQKIDVNPWLERILNESESVAFAGLLFDVGKYKLSLFEGLLRPLLSVYEFYEWDLHVTAQRSSFNAGLIGWGMGLRQSPKLVALAREWYQMPHRHYLLQDIAIRMMLLRPKLQSFFKKTRADWVAALSPEQKPESLHLLTEKFNPENYSRHIKEDGSAEITFAWPTEILERNTETLRQNEERMRLTMLPYECRSRLDERKPLSEDELPSFWQTLKKIDEGSKEQASQPEEETLRLEDAICGCIAVLLSFHSKWFAANPDKLEWCRSKLEKIHNAPPSTSLFDADTAVGNNKWDAFSAECGVIFLRENSKDILARKLVAAAITAHHYQTTQLTIERMFHHRESLIPDYDQAIHLVLLWSHIRHMIDFSVRYELDADKWEKRRKQICQEFVQQKITTKRPLLQKLNATGAAECDELFKHKFPEREAQLKEMAKRRPKRREGLHITHPGIDLQIIVSSHTWLDLKTANSPEERAKRLSIIRELLDLSLSAIPKIEDSDLQEIEGSPYGYDTWVYGLVARTLPHMTTAEKPESLWKPIVDLGLAAHYWVEHFFWEWFTDGVEVASPKEFVAIWSEMIEYALAHTQWDPERDMFHLEDMVRELLGLHFGVLSLGKDEQFAEHLGSMVGIFERCAHRWFRMPRVARDFASLVVQPAGRLLLVPSIRWLSDAVGSYKDRDWRWDDLEDQLVHVLRLCWERHSETVRSDQQLRDAFLKLLTLLTSRGGHAATALRDRVAGVMNVN
jgi:hypothetical protein